MAAIYDPFMSSVEEACLEAWRAELLAGLEGEVLEVGAGTGANLRHYPEAVTRLVLAEPERHMHERLLAKVRAGAREVELSPAPADDLPFPDGAFDAVVCTLVLCSVPDPTAALREIRRVLRPGGKLVFMEHVAAEDGTRRRVWQGRVEPLWRSIAGNCHLTRHTEETIRHAGFTIESEKRESIRKAMPLTRPSIRGVATKT